MHRTQDGVSLCELHRIRNRGDTEIRDLDRSVILDQDVLRFDVAVNDVVFMRFDDGCQELIHDLQGFLLIHSASGCNQFFQCFTADVLHHNEVLTFIFPHIVDFHNVGMVQTAGRIGLPLKAQ